MTARRPYWLGASIILIGLIWLWQASYLPQFAQYAELGPGFTVSLVGGILVLLGLILIWQIARGESFESQEGEDVDADKEASWPALFLAIAGAAVPLATMQHLGFPITAMLSFSLVTRAFGSRRIVFNAIIGLGLGLACWYGFGLLGVPLGHIIPVLGI